MQKFKSTFFIHVITLVILLVLASCSKDEPQTNNDVHPWDHHTISNVLCCDDESIKVEYPSEASSTWAYIPPQGGKFKFSISKDAKFCVDYPECWLHNKNIVDADLRIVYVGETGSYSEDMQQDISENIVQYYNGYVIYHNQNPNNDPHNFFCPIMKCESQKDEISISLDPNTSENKKTLFVILSASMNNITLQDFSLILYQEPI